MFPPFCPVFSGHNGAACKGLGTEPVLRVMVEAQSDELCAKYVNSVVNALRRKGHIFVQAHIGHNRRYDRIGVQHAALAHILAADIEDLVAVHDFGILTSLKIMEVMLEKKTKLSELAKDIEIYPQQLVNVKVASALYTLFQYNTSLL